MFGVTFYEKFSQPEYYLFYISNFKVDLNCTNFSA
jgi:hypothetical protein